MAGSHAVLFSLSSTAFGSVSSCNATDGCWAEGCALPLAWKTTAQSARLWILLERRAQLLVPPLLRHATSCVSKRLPRGAAARAAGARTWYSVSQAGRGGITIGRRSKTQAHTTAEGAVAAALSLRGAARNAESTPSRSTDDATTQPEGVPCAAASRRSGEVRLSARRNTCAAEAARSIRRRPAAVQRQCSA